MDSQQIFETMGLGSQEIFIILGIFVAAVTVVIIQHITQRLAKRAFHNVRLTPLGRGIVDFFTFKFMMFPVIVQGMYVLGIFSIIYLGVRELSYGHAIGLLILFCGPFALHLIFEFIMLPFAILDTLRESRDELRELKDKLPSVTATENTKEFAGQAKR